MNHTGEHRSMKDCSRRTFLRHAWQAFSTVNAAVFSSRAFGSASAGEVRAGSGERQPRTLFRDPREAGNLSTAPGSVEVDLEAGPAAVSVNGAILNLLTYDNSIPGPTLRVRQGDLLTVHFRNALPGMGKNILGHDQEATNLHVHGLHVPPAWDSNNAMLMLLSGNTFDHHFDLALQEPGTLHLYHPLSPGSAAEQCWGGMAGALIVEDATEDLAGFETHLMLLKDLSVAGAAPEPYTSLEDFRYGKEGDLVLVNGQVNPVLVIRPGQVQRWRIANTSNARFFRLSLEEHVLQVIGTDGGLLDRPHACSELLMAPGERVDLLVKARTTPKQYRLLAKPCDRGAGSAGRQTVLVTLSCEGMPESGTLPVVINASATRAGDRPVKTERIVLGLDRGRGTINGLSFGEAEECTIESVVGTFEQWEIENQSPLDLAFHTQTNAFQVLSLRNGDPAYASLYTRTPAWKDTVIVPRKGTASLLVRIAHFTGRTFFHCRIMEHADLGMMGVWDIVEAEEATNDQTERD